MLEVAAPMPAGIRASRYWWGMRLLVGAVAFLVIGNLLILATHLWLQRTNAPASVAGVPITNFTSVDDRLWRGAAPTARGYQALADEGVTTIVDLRAEEDIRVEEEMLGDLGLTRFHLPMRDGQAPGPDLVDRFLQIVASSPGRVYVHCGAGVGRTGTMAAAYLVAREGTSSGEAVRRNLAVGPPSLEQIAFASGLRQGEIKKPPTAVVALSRVLDAPRRIWVGVRKSYE